MSSTYDGHPRQDGLAHLRLTGRYPEFSVAGLVEGLVIECFFPDEQGNRSRVAVEYTVRDLNTSEKYFNARVVQSVAGMLDGEENVLHSSEVPTQPGAKKSEYLKALYSDGDMVLVGFVGGSTRRPVILGVLAHTQRTYAAKKIDGERRYFTHKGTSVEVKSDGTYQIKRGTTTVTVNADETIVAAHKSGATLTFKDSGDVVVVPATGKNIMLGADGLALPLDGVVHGSGIDTFTGAPYATLNNASVVVLSKK